MKINLDDANQRAWQALVMPNSIHFVSDRSRYYPVEVLIMALPEYLAACDLAELAMDDVAKAGVLFHQAGHPAVVRHFEPTFLVGAANHHLSPADLVTNAMRDVPEGLSSETLWLQMQLAERCLECAMLRLSLGLSRSDGVERARVSQDLLSLWSGLREYADFKALARERVAASNREESERRQADGGMEGALADEEHTNNAFSEHASDEDEWEDVELGE